MIYHAAASLTVTANTDDVPAPSRTSNVDPPGASTNISALDMASAKIEAFVRMLHYPQQRAVLQDNTLRYLQTFADFYRESKTLLKTKEDPTYFPSFVQDHDPHATDTKGQGEHGIQGSC